MIDLWALWPFPARLSDAAQHFYDKVEDVAVPLLSDNAGHELTLKHCVYVLLSRPGADKAFYSFGAQLCPLAYTLATNFMPVAGAPDVLKMVATRSDREENFYYDIRVSRRHVARAIRDYRWACGAEDKPSKYNAWRLATAARAERELFLLPHRIRNTLSAVRPYFDWRFYARGLAMMAGLN